MSNTLELKPASTQVLEVNRVRILKIRRELGELTVIGGNRLAYEQLADSRNFYEMVRDMGYKAIALPAQDLVEGYHSRGQFEIRPLDRATHQMTNEELYAFGRRCANHELYDQSDLSEGTIVTDFRVSRPVSSWDSGYRSDVIASSKPAYESAIGWHGFVGAVL